MRCFIAIELDDETRSILSGIQKKLIESGVKGNFTRKENLHLTVKFLGEIDIRIFGEMKKIIEKISVCHKSFVLTLDKIGKFDRGNRKIIWAGVSGSRELERLFADVEAEVLKVLPFGKEKRYTPHITLAREAVLPDHIPGDIVPDQKVSHSFRVTGISLMESTRVNGTLTYIRKARAEFNDA